MRSLASTTGVGPRFFLTLYAASVIGMWSAPVSAQAPPPRTAGGEVAPTSPNAGEALTPDKQADQAAGESTPLPLIRLWNAPNACLSLNELLARTQREVQGLETQDRSLEGRILAQNGKWLVTFVVFERGQRVGERALRLDGGACRDHDETLALVVALLLEHGPPPESERTTLKEAEDPTPEPHDEIEDPKSVDVEPAGKMPPGDRQLFRFSAGLQLVGGWLPNTSVGPMIGFGVTPLAWFLFEIQGSYLPGQQIEVLSGRATVDAAGGRLHVRTCAASESEGQWGVFGCVGGGWLAQKTRGDDGQDTDHVFLGSAEVSATGGLNWAISRRVTLSMDAGVSHPFRQGRYFFIVDGERALVYETKPVLGLLVVSAHFKF